ncbi:MAG: hydroxymethylglutaryl-CoA lyase [Thermoanaerobaculia bacterium]
MNPIVLHEVGPRDGLQIEKEIVPTARKISWIETIVESGVDVVQLGSFVNPERVPQMADTEQLFARFRGRRFSALVLNEKGFERGLACGVEFFCMGASASDTHSRKNTGMSTAEAMTRIIAIAQRALAAGATVQVSVQSAFGCGYEGEIPQRRVLDMVQRYLDAGLLQISLADTAGHAHPAQVEDLFGAIRTLAPGATLACHFHDTYGLALANSYAALRSGVRSFESAVGGLGGCPFTAVSGGNVPTEDLVHMLQRMGLRGDIALAPLMSAAKSAREMVGHPLPGRIHVTGPVGAVAVASSQ